MTTRVPKGMKLLMGSSRGLLATSNAFSRPRTISYVPGGKPASICKEEQPEPGFRKVEGGTEQKPRQAEAMPGVNAARRQPDGALGPFITHTPRAKDSFGEEPKDGVRP
jgi:hypothetical protein